MSQEHDPSSLPDLISIGKAADALGVSIDTIRRWEKEGVIKAYRSPGGHRLFSTAELEQFKANKPLTISEAATELGVSPSTLRRYEEQGRLAPQRKKNGERIYTKEIINNFKSGKKAETVGTPLPQDSSTHIKPKTQPAKASSEKSITSKSNGQVKERTVESKNQKTGNENASPPAPQPIILGGEPLTEAHHVVPSPVDPLFVRNIAGQSPHQVRQIPLVFDPTAQAATSSRPRIGRWVTKAVTLVLLAMVTGLGILNIKSQITSKQRNEQNKLLGHENGIGIPYEDATLATGPAGDGRVLAITTEDLEQFFEINVPTIVNAPFQVNGDATITGLLELQGNVEGPGIDINLGTGRIFASNIVNSLQGQAGDVTLQAGDGIAIDGTTIINTAPAQTVDAQNTFSILEVGQDSITASGPDDAITFTGSGGINLTLNPSTNTLDIDGSSAAITYTAGSDLELNGTEFAVSSTLTGVNTINGLTTLDTTSETTVENAIFDTDAEIITGAWTVDDNVALEFGADSDWTLTYDETDRDQLLLQTTNTAASAIGTPLFEVLVGTTPTPDQNVFGVAKGTPASNTDLFTIDEDGDVTILGSITLNGETYTFPPDQAAGNGALLSTDGAGSLTWISAGAGGLADVLAVGDCDSGECFNGTSGTELTFNDATGDGLLTIADLTAPAGRTWTLPDDDGTFILSGHTLEDDVTATIGASGSTSVTVQAINGTGLGDTTATSGNLLIANGTQWQTVGVNGGATINSSGTLTISDNYIEEAMLQIDNTPTGGQCLTFENSSGNFEWEDCDAASNMSSFDITDGLTTDTIDNTDNTITFSDDNDVLAVTVSPTNTVSFAVNADSIDGTELADSITLDNTFTLTDGVNTLFSVADGGSVGNVNITGSLTLGTALAVAEGGTGATTLNDLITLGTHTTGNYVATITNGNGISGSASAEGATPTLAVDLLDSADSTGLTFSNSGLEFAGAGSNELALIQGCSDQQLLKWDETNNRWFCASGSGTSAFDISDGATTETIQDSNILLFSDGTSIDFVVSATDTVTADVINDSIDGSELADAITLDSGSLLFDDGTANFFAIVDNGTQGEIRLYEDSGSGSNYISLKTPATLAGDINLTFPSDDGTVDYVLTTDGNGVLTWEDPTTVGSAGDIQAVGTCLSGQCFIDGNTTDYQLIFEGATDDAFEITLAAADAASDTTITLPNLTGTVILSGHEFTAGGDVTGTLEADGTTVLTIANDAVTLGTQTTGNYVAVVNTTGSLTGGSAGSEGASLTIDVADDSINGTELADNFTVEDGTLLDFSAIVHNDSTAQGIKLPQNSSLTAISGGGEGYLAWDTDDDQLKVYDGSAWQDVATGVSTAWDDISDPDADQTLNMVEYATVFDWNTDVGGAFDAFTYNITNDVNTANAQRLMVLTNADDGGANGTTENLLTLSNLDTNESVATAITIDSAAGGIATAIDLSDPEIVTALNVGANDIVGTTGAINFTFFDVDASGNITAAGDLAINGDDITSDGALTINATSYVRIGDSATPGSASGDDDLFVQGDLEVDGITYLDGDAIFANDTLLDLSAISHNDSSAQGIKLPQNTSLTALSGAGEGFLAWDTDDDQVKVFNGTAWVDIATGISTAWNDIGDPGDDQILNMAAFTTDFDWNTADTAAALDAFALTLTNDASTDAAAQRLLVLENADAAGSSATERLLVLNNLDTTEAVTTALEIISEAGTIGTAIDVSDDDITTALNIGANEIAGTTGTINFNNFDVDASGNITTTGNLTVPGTTTFNTVAYTWPGSDGSNGQVLTTNSAGTLSWSDKTVDTDTFATVELGGGGTLNGAAPNLNFDSTNFALAESPDNDFAISIADNGIALSTKTTGNYVANVATTGSLTGGSAGSEGATLTLDVADDTIDGSELADSITLDAGLTLAYEDAATNSVTDILTLAHTSSGTPAAGLGTGLSFQIEDAGGLEEQAAIDAVLTDVTNGSETSDIILSVQQSGAITEILRLDGANDEVTVSGDFEATGDAVFGGTTTLNSLTYTWPASLGADRVLTTDASGGLSWQTVGGLGAGGDVTQVGDCTTDACFTGTSGTVLTFEGGETLDASTDGTIAFTDGTNDLFAIVDDGTRGSIRLFENTANGSHYTSFTSPASLTNNVTYTLPSDAGTVDYALVTDGNGNLSWADVGGTGSSSGDIQAVGDCTSGACFADGGVASNTLYFEGATDDGIEVLLTAADATTSDKTITLPDRTGTVILSSDTFSGDITATLEDDGDTALAITADVVDGAELADNITLDAGLTFTQATSGHSITVNYTDTGSAQADAFIIQGAASTTITDGLDVSDAEIVNAINIGANNILTSGGTISSTELDVLTGGIVLGTDTSGDFVGTVTAGTGLASSGATTGEDIDHALSFDCSEVEGTDIDCVGEAITLETTLDSVTTINGLTTLDATSEDTVEGAIFDNDAQNISGVWEVQDDTNFAFGNDANWTFEYDETTDDQLLLTTTNTGATATTDPLIEILVPATPTADQQLFGIAKGTQVSNTPLFTVDEDGDIIASGTTTFGGITYTWPTGPIGGNDYVLTAQTDGTLAWANSAATADIITVGDCETGACFTADGTASNQLYFEGATGDGFEVLLTAADATSDTTITLPNLTGTVILSGHEFIASGDVTGTLEADGTTELTIANDSVALSTQTTGNYVTSITNGDSITGADGGSEGAALTLDVLDDSIDGTELADIISLEDATGLTIDDGTNTLLTITDAGTTGNLSVTGGLTVPGATTFNGVAYTWPGADGAADAVLSTDGAGGLTWNTIAGVGAVSAVGDCGSGDCFTGSGTSSTSLTFDDADGDGVLQVGNLSQARTWTLPDLDGTVLLSGHTFTGDITATLEADGSTALTIATGAITSDKILDGTIQEVDFEVTNSASDNQILSYDQASGGFTWVNDDSGGSLSSFDISGDTGTDETITDGEVLEIAGGTGIATVAGATNTITVNLDHLGIEDLSDPNADRIFFWDDSANASAWLAPDGTVVTVNGTTLEIANDSINGDKLADTITLDAALTFTQDASGESIAINYTDTVTPQADAFTITGAASTTITDAIDVSDDAITNAINIGDNTILGAAGVIDFTNFDVDASGNIAGVNLTNTGTVDFSGATSLEIPNGATPTVNANGEIAVDTTVTDFSHGILKYYSGEELGLVGLPIAQFTSPTDGYLIAYNATNDEFELVADDSGGSLSSFTISDGANDTTITDADTFTVTGGDSITYAVSQDGDAASVDITDDTVNFTELSDSLALDAATTITLGTNNFDINLDSTGEFAIQDGGSDVFKVDANGTSTFSDDVDLSFEAAENISLTKTAASTSDYFTITDGGTGTLTTGVDAFSLSFTQGADGADSTDITNYGVNVAATASGEAGDTLYGVNIAGISSTDSTEYGLVIGTGWDTGLLVNSTSEFTEAITYSGSGRPTRQVTLSPEYEGASLSGDGSSNIGTMTSDFCAASTGVGDVPAVNTSVCNASGDMHSYYSWTTGEGTAQDYDIWIRYRVPDNFDSWASNPIDVFAKRTDATNNAVTAFVYDTAGTLENASGTQVAGTSWTSTTVESSFAGTYTPGSYMTIRLQMTADTGGDSVQVGEINLDYLTNN